MLKTYFIFADVSTILYFLDNVTNGTVLTTGQCYRRDNITDGTMLLTGKCYRRDKGRPLKGKLIKILGSQQDIVTDRALLQAGTMLLTGHCYRQANVTDRTMLQTGHRFFNLTSVVCEGKQNIWSKYSLPPRHNMVFKDNCAVFFDPG